MIRTKQPKPNKIKDLSRDKLIVAVKQSTSIRALLKNCNVTCGSATYRDMRERLVQENIDVSDMYYGRIFSSTDSLRFKVKIPLELVLVENSEYARHSIKRRLVSELGWKLQCVLCQLGTEWNGIELSLQLDHINGIPTDNRIENLRFLCPNCHSQTKYYAGRGRKFQRKQKASEGWRNRPRISQRKVERPTLPELEHITKTFGFLEAGRRYGVSDNAVRKWIKSYKNNIGV